MEMETEKIDDLMKVRIAGHLDALTSPEAEQKVLELIDSGENRIYLDLQHVDYLTSAGLQLLLKVSRSLEDQSGKLAVCAVHPNVIDILKMSGMDRIIPIFRSESEALDSIKSSTT